MKSYCEHNFLTLFAAIAIDPDNWKGHWRKGVALMSMSKRQFRTKQAIEAFESCRSCSTLPSNKKAEVAAELNKAKARMEQQDAEVGVLCLLIDSVLYFSLTAPKRNV